MASENLFYFFTHYKYPDFATFKIHKGGVRMKSIPAEEVFGRAAFICPCKFVALTGGILKEKKQKHTQCTRFDSTAI